MRWQALLYLNQGLVKGAILCFRNPWFYFRHGESTSTANQKSKDLNKVSLLLQDLDLNAVLSTFTLKINYCKFSGIWARRSSLFIILWLFCFHRSLLEYIPVSCLYTVTRKTKYNENTMDDIQVVGISKATLMSHIVKKKLWREPSNWKNSAFLKKFTHEFCIPVLHIYD